MLKDLLGENAVVKVLDFLADEWEIDFSTADIARETGLTWRSVAIVVPVLLKYELVKESRQIARAKLYRLNRDNKIYQAARRLGLEIANFRIERELEKPKQEKKMLARVLAK